MKFIKEIKLHDVVRSDRNGAHARLDWINLRVGVDRGVTSRKDRYADITLVPMHAGTGILPYYTTCNKSGTAV